MVNNEQARVGRLGRDVHPVRRRRHGHGVLGRGGGNPIHRRARHRRRSSHAIRAATWRGRRCGSASPTPPSSPPSPPTPRAARSTPCTTPSRRSAAWCRWSTSSSASGVRRRWRRPLRHARRWSSSRSSSPASWSGRTPEYLGKKIEAARVQLASLFVLVYAFVDPRLHRGRRSSTHGRPGRSEQRRAARLLRDPLRVQLDRGNNGSAFAGLTGSTYFYNTMFGFAMLSRPVRDEGARAGAGRVSCAEKRVVPAAAGRSRSTTPLFVALLLGVILIVSALTFFPALSLGPDRRSTADAGRAPLLSDVCAPWPQSTRPLFDPPIVSRARSATRSSSSRRATWCGTR